MVPGAVAINHSILPADTKRGDEDYELLAELYGLKYAYVRENYSYEPGLLPLWITALVNLPPDFVTTDMEARKFLVGVETVKMSAFGISLMVRVVVAVVVAVVVVVLVVVLLRKVVVMVCLLCS